MFVFLPTRRVVFDLRKSRVDPTQILHRIRSWSTVWYAEIRSQVLVPALGSDGAALPNVSTGRSYVVKVR